MGDAFDWIEDLGDEILGTEDKEAAQQSAQAMASIASQLFNQTNPLRSSMIGNWDNMLKGGMDVTKSPMFGAGKYNIGSQYNTARENIMGSLPSGGTLLDALSKSYVSEAGDTANMMGNVAQDEYNKAYGMASGAPQTAISGFGNAGALSAQNYGSKLGKGGDVGMGAGYALGGK